MKKANALLQEQMSVNTVDNEESTGQTEDMNRYVQVEDSPFTCVQIDGERWTIVMGNQVVSDQTFETSYDAIEYVNSKPWMLLMGAAYLYAEYINKNYEQIKNETK